MKSFKIITGNTVDKYLMNNRTKVINTVKDAYNAHFRNETENPPSHFLKFRKQPNNRIIALLSHLNDDFPISGMKWIASYPSNIEKSLQRASAVMVLNDASDGYPVACIEASKISSARTAASAVLSSGLYRARKKSKYLSIIGCGIIALEVLRYYDSEDWDFDEICLYDLNELTSKGLKENLPIKYKNITKIADSLNEIIQKSDHIIFTTTVNEPYFKNFDWLQKEALILNISLRDIDPNIILQSYNVVDDIDHCLKAKTSPHLAFEKKGNINFINQTIPSALVNGAFQRTNTKPLIISPFGMGILDLAVARQVLFDAEKNGDYFEVPNFFNNIERH